MTDYRNHHETLVREDHDYRNGWSIRYEIGTGLWFLAGLVIGLLVGAL